MANLIRRKDSGSTEPARLFDPFEVMPDLMRWDPFAELAPTSGPGIVFVPSFEVKETSDGYVFNADLPGVKESDLELSLTGNRRSRSPGSVRRRRSSRTSAGARTNAPTARFRGRSRCPRASTGSTSAPS